jgi:hypothetical protein
MKNKTILYSLASAAGTAGYIVLISLFFINIQSVSGSIDQNSIFGPIFMLLLFVFSAAATSAMVLGRPILLYLDNSKKEALRSFVWTLIFLFAFILVTALIFVLV